MLLYIPGEEHTNLVFFDTEFDEQKLVQVAMIHYEKIYVENIPTYLLKGSINIYIKRDVSYFFTNHTGITYQYLEKFGVEENEARFKLNNFVEKLNSRDTLFVSHGIKQDLFLLLEFGVKVGEVDRYCTYENAKRLLNRGINLKLIDVCNDAGYFTDQHDAYTDSKNVVHAFSHLKLVETL